ncbi:hypothetical protein ACHAW5_006682 [Stephanodiscus triporus]|uniref:Methyltransferase n=1 Tax=Stephanodiscus triporus TaxID=2934178 RepID=A0ABD3MJ21_9STRA
MVSHPIHAGGGGYLNADLFLFHPLVLSAVATIGASIIVQLVSPSDPWGKTLLFLKQLGRQERGNMSSAPNVESSVGEYERLTARDTSADERNSKYKMLVNSYYDLVTLFYEWGWGTSFHFANRHPHESFDEAMRRHEYYLASKLNLSGALRGLAEAGGEARSADREGPREGCTPSMAHVKILDVGCGIGGPMRNICKFTGADVTGLTLNQYQVDRGNELCRLDPHFRNPKGPVAGLPDVRCRSVQGDFMRQPFASSSFDAAYAIEATCHAPDRVKCYSEVYRVLKPGAVFANIEWCITDKYDPENPEHVLVKKQIEVGDGLPDIASTHHCLASLRKAGFEILEERDLVKDEYGGWQDPATGEYSTSEEALKRYRGGKPWMLPLMPSWNPFLQRFQFNWFGLRVTKYSLMIMEFLRIAPVGTSRTQVMLQTGAIGLARAGELGIFTPMYLMVGRVPLDKKD